MELTLSVAIDLTENAEPLDSDVLAAQVDAVLNEDLYWFPVRHHSAAVSRHVEAAITKRRPKVVFLEAPAEAQALIPHVIDAETRPPIAIYSSYRDDDNVLGLAGIASAAPTIPPRFACWYPLLAYSPELIAMQAAAKVSAEVVFIDLPHYGNITPHKPEAAIDADKTADKEPVLHALDSDQLFVESGFYQALAQAAGYKSWDETWDTLFESSDNNADTEWFRRELATFCAAVRMTSDPMRIQHDGTLERERHFMQVIRSTLKSKNIKPTDAMVVCGGFHLFLDRNDDTPVSQLPAGTVYTTVVPYSFFRISELSGYGAGNRAPQFYQTAWEFTRAGRQDDLLAEYVVLVLKQARKEGQAVSSADAISITQHARMLAGLRGRSSPVLDDIQDAIITCCCKGDPAEEGVKLRRAIDDINIGTKIGKVTSKLGRLPIVTDFYHQLSTLDLGQLLDKEKRLNLELDKRQALDERRSVFLHRLIYLEVPLATRRDDSSPDLATGLLFREYWGLKWSPKVEPALVEQNLYGDTLEAAVLSKLREALANDGNQAGAACSHLRRSIDMDLPNLVSEVQIACGTAVDQDPRFVSLCVALGHLLIVDRYAVYRSLRRVELASLIVRCFDRACFALDDVASAPEDQQAEVVAALQSLAEALLKCESNSGASFALDRDVFVEHVRGAAAQSTVPFLRGAFLGMLAELRDITADALAKEVSAFALSTPDRMVFAGDFLEGVLAVSRTSVMLGAKSLVRAIDELLRAADWNTFLTMLPRLRAAFERLHDRQVDSLAAAVARKYGLSPDHVEQLTELKTSVGAAAIIADIDRQVAEIMSKWGF